MALPKSQRVPHTLDKNGFARPLTEQEIKIAEGRIVLNDNNEQVEVELSPPWEQHPAYLKHKAFFDSQNERSEADLEPEEEAEEDEEVHEYEEEEVLSQEEQERQEWQDEEAREVQADVARMMRGLPPMPRKVLDVLNFAAEEVVEDITIDQYLDQYKDFAPISERLVENDGEMYRYQQTFIDEKDLAQHDFRKDKAGTKSLEDFIHL
jgi:hypothetical protein